MRPSRFGSTPDTGENARDDQGPLVLLRSLTDPEAFGALVKGAFALPALSVRRVLARLTPDRSIRRRGQLYHRQDFSMGLWNVE